MFIDKPITCSVEDAEQMVKMAKDLSAGVVLIAAMTSILI